MITGDTLFAGGGIGRTDFKFGDFDILRVSLRRILSMDGEITILPGHGGASKIGYEQRALLY
jgi:glyoxylase-like metal-dependent hydrolase (beta-lactamase superfamily II)